MRNDYQCPYCGAEIEDPDYWEHEPCQDYETVCNRCGRSFEVSYDCEPWFYVTIPEELKPCRAHRDNGRGDDGRCVYWNLIDDFCQFPDKSFELIHGKIATMHSNCPLGHKEVVEE